MSWPDAMRVVAAPKAEHDLDAPASSPLWPLVAVLASIAARVERRRAEEHDSGEEVA